MEWDCCATCMRECPPLCDWRIEAEAKLAAAIKARDEHWERCNALVIESDKREARIASLEAELARLKDSPAIGPLCNEPGPDAEARARAYCERVGIPFKPARPVPLEGETYGYNKRRRKA